jgi:hypothetical protein
MIKPPRKAKLRAANLLTREFLSAVLIFNLRHPILTVY